MIFLFLGIGLAAGVLAGLFGIGGGIIIVPALIILARMSPVMASGTSLAALVLPVGIVGAWEYYRNGHLDLRAALWVAGAMVLGVYFGSRLAQIVDSSTLQRLFAVFLVIVAVRVWFTA